jgi:hypothetical protein
MVDKPFSQACENNKSFILDELRKHFVNANRVLEIGSGSGQHAVHFAPNLPHLQWHCADQTEYHSAINAWIDDFPSDNLHRPINLSFPTDPWPPLHFDGVFTANTAHIMLKDQVELMMKTIAEQLPKGGVFCQYGPFTINGKFSSQSNADFHEQLIENGRGGYRGIEELEAWVPSLALKEIVSMPANNLMLIWHKD